MPDPTSAAVRGKSIPRASLHTVEADGVRVFYREAGPADAPVLLLLHGYPASSQEFVLADRLGRRSLHNPSASAMR